MASHLSLAKPDIVRNLTVVDVTEQTVFLSWDPPVGNHSFYTVQVIGHPDLTKATRVETHLFENLTPGDHYTFSVNAEVESQLVMGVPVNVSAYTRPGEVQNLTVLGTNATNINLRWKSPEGKSSWFRVHAYLQGNSSSENYNVNETQVVVHSLIPGSEYRLDVVAFSGDPSLAGRAVKVKNFTTPAPVKNLTLKSTQDSITATWEPPVGNFCSYKVVLNGDEMKTYTTKENMYTFSQLGAALEYNVTVYTQVAKSLESQGVSAAVFTLPFKPTSPSIKFANTTAIQVTWQIPQRLEGKTVTYEVRYNASYWSHEGGCNVTNNSVSVGGLRSGTLYTFEIRTLAGTLRSDPAIITLSTVPNKKYLTLMMTCSSETPLLCEKNNTRDSVFKQLQGYFKEKLDDKVFWELEWKNY
ncbi:receptor-type tyrosine-protein phosphatase eta-like [Megalops cyprinoides]|uniref:receptor-type tyrosine-protein phosphatase eta-like n=1 Tax=Megalops cyprinoides TaxID=118141 RepID=UPI001863A701|nr:receptor-type tyrosine-protein phosphatase eta-like [Megalops cyprinoides]